MNRQEKELVIKSLKNEFAQSNAAFLVGVKGLTVADLQKLRKDLRSNGGSLKITKARLMRIAAENDGSQDLNPFFKDQVGLVFSKNEPSSVAKVLYNFSKTKEALKLIAGVVESQLYDKQLLAEFAQLPSKEVLLAQLCGTLKAPIVKLAVVLDMITKKLEEQPK